MADDKKLAKMYETQKSLTEWLEDIKHKDVEALRREDNDKRERLQVLNNLIGLPFDKPVKFDGADLSKKTKALTLYIDEHGTELCALRLIPKEDGLPKLRMRGKSVAEAYDWFLEQDIDAAKYRADFVPHPIGYTWSTIFVVNQHGIHGEVIKGMHYQLTQGFHEDTPPHTFSYDFKKWVVEPANPKILKHLKELVNLIYVDRPSTQRKAHQKLGATFASDYLEGYFETYESNDYGVWYIDYSPTLGEMYSDVTVRTKAAKTLGIAGQTGSPGKAKGPVRIVHPDGVDGDFPKGAVLVCDVTTPNYVPLMQKASAIVTDQGGILSHAAIVARELKKPCIVGTGNATKKLKNGQIVSVDADSGSVTVIR